MMPIEPQNPAKHRFTVIFAREDEGGYHVFCPAAKQNPQGLKCANSDVLQIVGGEMQPSREHEAAFG